MSDISEMDPEQAINELQRADDEARTLALAMWRRHYREESPNFDLCDSVPGVISQIDNMWSGLINELTAAKAEIEQLRAELGEKKRDLHHWWKRGLDAECLVEEMEAEAAERGGDNDPV